ncbi:hypothetical protein CKO35_01495 [Ectothiorhodospira shaposhnikovii]|nr:hypothetical protein [Ectothiorhodospira shaposhnikovii]
MDTMSGNVILIGWDGSVQGKAVERLLKTQGLACEHRSAQEAVNPVGASAEVLLVRESGAQAPRLPVLQALHDSGNHRSVILVGDCLLPEQVVQATRMGALDVLPEPLDNERLMAALQRARLSSLSTHVDEVIREDCPSILGSSPKMVEVFKQLGVAASNDLNVLLTGETGVGKEVSAYCIHRHSARAGGPYVAINCTAIPEGLLEAELFGHARGAYTNAVSDGIGKIEAAQGGTLLLDEIGDMSPTFQAKLLRFLEDKQFHRLGDASVRSADVRIIAATNRNLLAEVEAGRFRRDLYYRLAQFPISIPPLRERPDDIRSLVRAFVAEANLRLGLKITEVSEEAEAAALGYHWPGNVRELKNLVYQAAVRTRVGSIAGFPFAVGAEGECPSSQGIKAGGLESLVKRAVAGGRVRHLLEEFEALTLRSLMEAFEGNRSRISEELGISRNTLRAKLKVHGL